MASKDKQTIAQLQARLAAANARASAAEDVVKFIRDELKNRNNAENEDSEALPEGTSKDTGIYDDAVGNARSDAANQVSVAHWKAYNAAFYKFEKTLVASKTDPQSASNTEELLKGLRALGTPRGSFHTTLAGALHNETTIAQSRATANHNNATHFCTTVDNINRIVEGYKPPPAGGADGADDATSHSGSGQSCSSGDLQSIHQSISDIRKGLLDRGQKLETMVGQHSQLTDELDAASQLCQQLMDSLEDLVTKIAQGRQLSGEDGSSHKAGDGSKRKRSGSNSEQSRVADLEQQVKDLQAVVDQLRQQISHATGDKDNDNEDEDNQDEDDQDDEDNEDEDDQDEDNEDEDDQDEDNEDEDNEDEDELKKRIKELEAELKKTKANRDRLQKALDDMQKKLKDCRRESWQDRKKRVQAEARAQKAKGAKAKKAGAIGRNELRGLGISF
ncbi:hypothetical protein BP5796_04785 [Coleophoma crateriformis]|uniref:Uncharacterized protein n=1 Tax=Coleophoma crateriformis TaxID=565419 RepID=A0A3D8SB10_9HELO|nr:hypothetical protein BP5796_04785 [Coleophoma crateriformis]